MTESNVVAHTLELLTYAFGGLMAWHAWVATRDIKLADTGQEELHPHDEPNRYRWLSTLLWGIPFGYVLECALITRGDYCYSGQSLVPHLPNVVLLFDHSTDSNPCADQSVPLWIAVGWAVLLYATNWTAQRLQQPLGARAMLAGLLAVNIDLSLDPIAQHFGVWKWTPDFENANYYGVPFDNFICWFVIVTTYTLVVRELFRLTTKYFPKLRFTALWVPFVGAAVAVAIVYFIDGQLQNLYKITRGDAPIFVAVFATACVIVGRHAYQPPFDRLPSRSVLALPLVYHALCLFLIMYAFGSSIVLNQPLPADGHITLLVAIPLALTVGFLAFGWASLERLFPRPQPQGGSPKPPPAPGQRPADAE